MRKLNLDELKLKKSELSRIKGGTTTTEVTIVGFAEEPCTVTENEYIGKVRDGLPDFTSQIPCDKV